MSDFLQEFIDGYIDALKDSGEWQELTKDEKKHHGQIAIEEAKKYDFHFNMLVKIKSLN